MGKLIHHTVTITITETWTITWTEDAQADVEPPPQATTIVPDQVKPQEEGDEPILPAITTGAATDAQPIGVVAKPKAGSQRKRPRRRRAGEDQGGM